MGKSRDQYPALAAGATAQTQKRSGPYEDYVEWIQQVHQSLGQGVLVSVIN